MCESVCVCVWCENTMDASSDSVAVEIRSFCLGIFFPVEKEKKKAKVQLQARHVWALQGG